MVRGPRPLYGVIASAVAVAALWGALRDGADPAASFRPPAVAGVEAAQAVPQPAPRAGGKGLVETFEVFAPKDPFDPALGAKGAGGRGRTVELVAARADAARISVDGTVHDVDEGDTFARRFRLVAAGRGCAAVLYGDDQFSLCKGDSVVK